MSRPLLYLAGPYTHPEPVENTHAACRVAMEIYERTEWCPFVPHLSLLWQAVTPRGYQHWLDYDFHILRRCDAVFRLPGLSRGADAEIEEAMRIGLRILTPSELPADALACWKVR